MADETGNLFALDAEQADDFAEMRRALPARPNLGPVNPAAGGGRNLQPVKRVAGDAVTGDAGRDLYPGSIIWQPAGGPMTTVAGCWLDLTVNDHPPDVGTPVLAFHSGWFTDDDDNTLPVFWAFGRSLCPGTDTPGYSGAVGAINVVTLDADGCLHCVQPVECS